MKRIMFLIPMIFLFVVGCAGTPKIYVNGAPPSSHMLMANSGKLQAFTHAHRHFIVREGEERRMAYESIPFGEIVQLPMDTLAISVVLRVANESKEYYQLWETFVLTDPKGRKTYRINQLYSGRLSLREFNVQCPIRNAASGKYSLKVADEEGKLKFVIGTIKFNWKGVEIGQEY